MRLTWIDGIPVDVLTCVDCPFFSTEFEIGARCRYPYSPALSGALFSWREYVDKVRKDCPLGEKR